MDREEVVMAVTDFSFAAVNDRNRSREMETYGPPRKCRDGFPVIELRPWLFGNEEWYLEGETWRRMPGAPEGEQQTRAEMWR